MTDWESLSKQLKNLGMELGKSKSLSKRPRDQHPIEEVVQGRFWDVIYGQVFCHEEFYKGQYFHGKKPLLPSVPITTLCQWANADQLTRADEWISFSGYRNERLAGGTGTYAFEVGVGRFTEDGFQLAQFLCAILVKSLPFGGFDRVHARYEGGCDL